MLYIKIIFNGLVFILLKIHFLDVHNFFYITKTWKIVRIDIVTEIFYVQSRENSILLRVERKQTKLDR